MQSGEMQNGGFKKRASLSSFQLIILGFAAVILVGALLLMLPISSKDRSATSFGESLFTATSAACVTGLVVRDTATHWSYFGQAVILVLIQIGGLGVITVAASLSMLAGKKLSLQYFLHWCPIADTDIPFPLRDFRRNQESLSRIPCALI